MKKIAIICAAPHFEFNPGMHSVDLAAFSFFSRHTFTEEIEPTFYLLHEPELRLKNFLNDQLPFKYELFLNQLDKIYASDLIFYWGDFLHNLPYHKELAKRLVQYNLIDNLEKAFDTVQQHFFLTDAPLEVLQKTVVFGSNFFINGSEDMLDETYTQNTTRFFNNIKRVWTRDILSAQRISHLKRNYTENYLGTDCSFLFDKGKKNKTEHENNHANPSWIKNLFSGKPKNKAGVFLGRMHKDFPPLFPFVNDLQKELHSNMEWIPWFWQNEEFYKSVKYNLPGVVFLPEQENIMALYESLKAYDYIVTDTYHLCLNAWRMGIPAICIGSGNSPIDGTLTDKKKEFFFYMYEAQDFYVFLEDIKDKGSRKQRIKSLAKYITQEKITENVNKNLTAHKAVIENQLVQLVASICKKQ